MSVSFCFLFFFFFLQNTSSFALLWDCVDEGKFERTIAGAEQEPGFRSPNPPWQTFMFVHLSHIVSLFLVQYCWTPFPESQQPAEHCGASKSVPRTWRSKIKREACWVTLGNFTFNFSLKGEKQKQKTHTTPLLFSVSFLPYITIKKITPSFSWE